VIIFLQSIDHGNFKETELSKISALANLLGLQSAMPTSVSEIIEVPEHLPFNSVKYKNFKFFKKSKNDTDEYSVTWGDSKNRFDEIPFVVKSCPVVARVRWPDEYLIR
jgi:hypothetical protein